MKKKNLKSWKLKKVGIIGALVAVSVIGAWAVYFDRMWILIPAAAGLLLIWMQGNRIYACPHCKTPVDLRLHLHEDTKCTQCGKPIVD